MAGEEGEVPSVGDSLAAALEQVENGEGVAGTTPDTPVGEPAAAEAPTETPAAARARGRDGKFTRQATADTPAHITAPGAPPAAPGEAAAPPAEDAPPARWKEIREKWSTLDPQVKAEINRREREVDVVLQRASETRKFGDSVAQEIAPYMGLLQSEGASPQEAIKVLLETAYTLRHGSPEHKKAIMLSMIQQYGVDFSQGINPDRAALERDRDLRANEDRRQQTIQQQEVHNAAMSELEQFSAQPGHEHIPVLRGHMIALLRNGQASNLQEAYDQAAWAHPQVRQSMQQAENLRRQQNFGRNRNAAAAVTGAPGPVNSAGPTVDPKNLRATIEAQFDGGRF